MYILPPLYYLRIRFLHLRFRRLHGQNVLRAWRYNGSHAGRVKDVIAVAILCLGVVSMVAATYVAIVAIVDAPGQQSEPPCWYWTNVTIPVNVTNVTAVF